eukprot:771359-Rhodomonas_salina.1
MCIRDSPLSLPPSLPLSSPPLLLASAHARRYHSTPYYTPTMRLLYCCTVLRSTVPAARYRSLVPQCRSSVQRGG